MSLGLPFCTWYKVLPEAYLLVSEYNRNLPLLSGMLSNGGFNNLPLISSNAFCCLSPQTKGLPSLFKSYMGFNSFCSSRQNILTKFTMPVKLLQPFWFVGGFNFWIASSMLLRGFTQTLFSLMKMVLPMYCNSVLNNWHFFREIFKPFLHNTHSKLISFSKYVCLLGVNSNRSSMIASQYFLLDKQLKIAFIYDCHTVGEMPSAFFGRNMMCYQNKEVSHNISWNSQLI